MTLLYVVLALLAVVCIFLFQAQARLEKARRQGIYPLKGQATMDDVKRLIQNGNDLLAIRAYREIHGTGLKKAKIEIERIKNEVG